jgi:hypothetical protein
VDAYQSDPSRSSERWSRERGGSWLGWGVAIVAALIVLAVIFVFMNGESPQRVAIADIESAASPMTGESVTVEGEVEERLSEEALTVRDGESDESLLVIVSASTIVDGAASDVVQVDPLGDSGALGGAEQIDPVAEPQPIMPVIPTSGPVRVVGTVDTFDRATLSEQLGISLGEETFGSFDGAPYLLADQIETSFDPSTVPPEESPLASPAG